MISQHITMLQPIRMKNFDFPNDLKEEISRIIGNSGLKISLEQDLQKILIDFFNLKSKFIEPKKRNVFVVPSFNKQIDLHHKKLEIKTIIKYSEKGENLNIFQSDKIVQSKQIDHLSNEWNIFHFHISLKPDKKPNFVKRGKLLIFAYIDEENIVFLGLDNHRESFSNIKWLELLDKHFPHILEKYLAPDIKVRQNFSTSDREKLWQNGVTSGFMNINGRTFISPGFAKVTSGHNVQIVVNSNNILNWLCQVELLIRKNSKLINENTYLKLRIGEKTIEIFENKSGKILFEYPNLVFKE